MPRASIAWAAAAIAAHAGGTTPLTRRRVSRARSVADPTTKNIQTQRNGFGTIIQKFQTVSDKSKCARRARAKGGGWEWPLLVAVAAVQ